MKVPAMIAAEFRRLTATRMSIIALLALMLVPVLYGGVYLWANQDPYGRLSEVPVALVNLDTGAENDGLPVNYGDEVAGSLLSDGSFDWRALDADAAAQRAKEAAQRGRRRRIAALGGYCARQGAASPHQSLGISAPRGLENQKDGHI